jgi:glycosyltransferase involved in cell wall biosynthesis
LGCSLDKDTNINYSNSLPNKLFDYIHAGIPILCSDIVEVANIVKKYEIGMVILSHDPVLIAEKIKEILTNEDKLKYFKQNLQKAAIELCWENEEKELMKIYGKLL